MSLKNLLKCFLSEPQIDGQLIFLFWDSITHYPSWLKNGNEKYVWPLVENATRTEKEKRYNLLLKNGESFVFIEEYIYKDYLEGSFKNVELYYKNNIVSSFEVSLDDISADYMLHKVEFIKEGIWQKTITEFSSWKKENDLLIKKNIDEIVKSQKNKKMNKTLTD